MYTNSYRDYNVLTLSIVNPVSLELLGLSCLANIPKYWVRSETIANLNFCRSVMVAIGYGSEFQYMFYFPWKE